MTDEDRARLIGVLLENADQQLPDAVCQVLIEHLRVDVFGGGSNERLAAFLQQHLDCEGPFARDDDGNVLPGQWVKS